MQEYVQQIVIVIDDTVAGRTITPYNQPQSAEYALSHLWLGAEGTAVVTERKNKCCFV